MSSVRDNHIRRYFMPALTLAAAMIMLGCATGPEEEQPFSVNSDKAVALVKERLEAQSTLPLHQWVASSINSGVSFRAPTLINPRQVESQTRFYRKGSIGKMQVSFNLGHAMCKGDYTSQHHANCVLDKVRKRGVIKVVENTVSITPHNDGVTLTYVGLMTIQSQKVRVINTHLLFEKDKRWGDLHASLLHPNQLEFLQMLKFTSFAKVINL
ncbi:hypothetical protein MHM98_00100 [Psychrobium sp. MM17-31]|uniref:hypothetical protein n=1 Tax=Psychrobium sp. MM17-31 TaxID=2917758 RepID=UPI001EF62E59|nr:hypothetical protein [Psychrobium sp. MM17-31]MCG7529770.1 hypothetical protein [Psychrobium sp. MM17-31]